MNEPIEQWKESSICVEDHGIAREVYVSKRREEKSDAE